MIPDNIHCFPLYLGMRIRVIKLVGNTVLLEHHIPATILSSFNESSLAKSLANSTEVSIDEFIKIGVDRLGKDTFELEVTTQIKADETSQKPLLEEKPGLFITTMIHDITQAGFEVRFNRDFEGQVRMGIEDKRAKSMVLEHAAPQHYHCGVPGEDLKVMEKDIIIFLRKFIEDHKI